MDFDLNDEQRLLSESVTRFVAERCGFEERAHMLASSDGFSRVIWRELAELGLLALPFAEEDGGFGGGGVETMLVMEALGRGLCLEPYLATAILAGGALRRAGSAAQKQARIPSIIAGERIMALAHDEPRRRRHTSEALVTRALRDGDGWQINGDKIAVIHGAAADELVVSARTTAGTSLFLVDPALPGVSLKRGRGYDGIPIAALRLDHVQVASDALLGEDGAAAAVLDAVFDEARAALAAEAVGIMADTIDLTIEYLKTRKQFGVAIGSFQALQHRAVDLLMDLELARSMATLAAVSVGEAGPARWRSIAAAKAQIGRAGRRVGQQAVQLHGAIGITSEYKVGHAFKRLTAIDALYGDADQQIERLASEGGLFVADAA